VAAHYQDISEGIEAYKYRSYRQYGSLYVDLLSKLIQEYYPDIDPETVSLVSVPMHWSRYSIRGFNHMDWLVTRLARQLGLTHISPLTAYWTRRQSKLTKAKRMKNRQDAFALKS
jgi:predicted amidophosphoribosyltransferase